MALGKNLKKQKLIDPEKKDKPKKKVEKKKLIATKKEAATPSKTKKPSAIRKTKKTEPVAKKKVATKKKVIAKPKKTSTKTKSTAKENQKPVKAAPQFDRELPIFIAKELQERKNTLRKRYIEEVTNMSGITSQFVIIEIGKELYAIDIDIVKEVVPIASISQTPNTPDHIKGIANVRGSTYVVFDLAKKFKLQGEFDSNYLLVVEKNEFSAALDLSLLPATRKINGSNVSSDLMMIENASLDVSYIKGLMQDQDQLIYYLDVIELIKNDKAIVVPDKLVEE